MWKRVCHVCLDGEQKSYGGQVIDVTHIHPQYSYIQSRSARMWWIQASRGWCVCACLCVCLWVTHGWIISLRSVTVPWLGVTRPPMTWSHTQFTDLLRIYTQYCVGHGLMNSYLIKSIKSTYWADLLIKANSKYCLQTSKTNQDSLTISF